MRSEPFTRPTLVAAVELLGKHNQGSFNQTILRLGLERDVPADTAISVTKKCAILGALVVQRYATVISTLDGSMTLGEAVIRQAAELAQDGSDDPMQTAFARGVARDGYVLVFGGRAKATLRAALPSEIALPQTEDEVHELLKGFGFLVPLGHLDQAIQAHTRGDWAAANGQLRTFIESLFDDIARYVRPTEAAALPSAENRRALLFQVGFFSGERNEWSTDGKSYLNGLLKMLHTEGAHPGLSDEDHCTFRLHVALVTARTFLRRFRYGQ